MASKVIVSKLTQKRLALIAFLLVTLKNSMIILSVATKKCEINQQTSPKHKQ
jgi:hypothetical protein